MKKLIATIKSIWNSPKVIEQLRRENEGLRIELRDMGREMGMRHESLVSRLNEEIPDTDDLESRLSDLESKLDDYPDYDEIVQTGDYDFEEFVRSEDIPDMEEFESRLSALEECSCEGGDGTINERVKALEGLVVKLRESLCE